MHENLIILPASLSERWIERWLCLWCKTSQRSDQLPGICTWLIISSPINRQTDEASYLERCQRLVSICIRLDFTLSSQTQQRAGQHRSSDWDESMMLPGNSQFKNTSFFFLSHKRISYYHEQLCQDTKIYALKHPNTKHIRRFQTENSQSFLMQHSYWAPAVSQALGQFLLKDRKVDVISKSQDYFLWTKHAF